MVFNDRVEAGKKLALRLAEYRGADAVVLAIPRGGVAVGATLARELGLPLDVMVVRKMGYPGQPELALGAIAADGTEYLEPEVMALGVPDSYLRRVREAEKREAQRREQAFRGELPPLSLAGKVVILCDDGIATGSTVMAGLKKIKNEGPKKAVLAVPVLPAERVDFFARHVDELVYVDAPVAFYAVGQFYLSFPQLSDAEVIELLREARQTAVG